MTRRYRYSTATKKRLTLLQSKPLKLMVGNARIELAAFGSGGQRSIQLSYGRTSFCR